MSQSEFSRHTFPSVPNRRKLQNYIKWTQILAEALEEDQRRELLCTHDMSETARAVARTVADGALVNVAAHPLPVGISVDAFISAADGLTESESDGEGRDGRMMPAASAPAASAPGISVATAAASSPAAPPSVEGTRVKMPARPLLERINFNAALAAHLRSGFMDTQLEQIQGGPNHGKFVAEHVLVKMTNCASDYATKKIESVITKHRERLTASGMSSQSWLPSYARIRRNDGGVNPGEVVVLDLEDMLIILNMCEIDGFIITPKTSAVASAPVASAPVASAPVASAPVAVAPVAVAPVAVAPVASAPGNRFKMSARPLLEHFDINYLNAKFGINALDTVCIKQMQGGEFDGMFVAHDAVAQLLEMENSNANRKVKKIVFPVPEPCNDKQREENHQKEQDFPSRQHLVGELVSLVHVLT